MALPSVQEHARTTVHELFGFIEEQGNTDYIGEAVSQLEHSLQSAVRAQEDNRDDETVIASLLHDVGRFIPAAAKMPKFIAPDGSYLGRASHDILGERYLRQLGFSEKICQLVGAHVTAKRYLCAVEKGYWESLSQSSKRTLEFQGGTYNEEQVKEAQNDPWLQEKLAVRRYDDLAKVPNLETPPLEAYENLAIKCLLQSRSTITLDSRTYALPQQPTVVVCVDGLHSRVFETLLKDGSLPQLAKLVSQGFYVTSATSPSSNTPEQTLSILTGAPPPVSSHDSNDIVKTDGDVDITSNKTSSHQNHTILSLLAKRGVRVAAIATEESRCHILAQGLDGAICVSGQTVKKISKADDGSAGTQAGLDHPGSKQISGDPSMHAIDAGIQLLEGGRADLVYLGLPELTRDRGSGELLSALDAGIGRFLALGALVALTGSQAAHDSELSFPLVLSRRVHDTTLATAKTWHNYDVLDLVLNW